MNWNNLARWVPRSVSQRCFTALALGFAVGLMMGSRAEVFGTFSQIYLRSLALVNLPYLVFEMVGSIAVLSPAAFARFFRRGVWIILGTVALGSGAVVAAPQLLPALSTSPLFYPSILHQEEPVSFVTALIPSNLFVALAQGNYAGITLLSVFVGVVVQRLPDRDAILAMVLPMRSLFNRIMSLVIRGLLPIGIFAITAEVIGKVDPSDLRRMAGLIVVILVPVTVLAVVVLPGIIHATLGIHPGRFFQIIRDPLMIAISTGSFVLVLPSLRATLESEIRARGSGGSSSESDVAAMEVYLLVSLTVAPLGKFVSLGFIPFAAWFIDMPINSMRTLEMLMTGLPSVAGGGFFTIVSELNRLGLPESLASQYMLNSSWTSRLTESLTLVSAAAGSLLLCLPVRPNPWRLMVVVVTAASAFMGLGILGQSVLTNSLKESNRSASIIMGQRLMETNVPIAMRSLSQPSDPGLVTPAAIRSRGVLRVGGRLSKIPWIYHNTHGELVGYDVELAVALAQSLGVAMEFWELDRAELGSWLREGRIDLILGGIESSPFRQSVSVEVVGYDEVHLGLLVQDTKLREFQQMMSGKLARSVVLGFDGQTGLSPELKSAIRSRLGVSTRKNGGIFFKSFWGLENGIQDLSTKFDGLITSAEEGSAMAVMHPSLTMVPALGRGIPYQVGFVTRHDDLEWIDYLKDWQSDNRSLGLFDRLRDHWFCFRRSGSTP